MVVFGQSGCIWAKLLLSGKIGCNRARVVVIGQKLLYSGKSGSIRAKVVKVGKKWLYSGKSSSTREKSGCIRSKVSVFG